MMATARLRKSFKYPSEDEASQDSRDELDEEEQETLITNLQSQSRISNAAYTIIFTLLPLALTPLFIYHLLFSSKTPARLRMLSLLAMTSLIGSSFSMFVIPIDTSDARGRLDRRQKQMVRATFAAPGLVDGGLFTRIMDKLDDIRLDFDSDGPLLQALPVLNGIMCGLLGLAAMIMKGQSIRGVPEYTWMFFLLPGIMLGMTVVARRSIMEEERGLRELRGLQYGYKGA